MNTCHYCRREMPHDHTNMEGQPWCGVCTWWAIELRRLRMRLGLMTSPRTPWRKFSAAFGKHIETTPRSAATKVLAGTHRIGLGVDVPSEIAEPTPCD